MHGSAEVLYLTGLMGPLVADILSPVEEVLMLLVIIMSEVARVVLVAAMVIVLRVPVVVGNLPFVPAILGAVGGEVSVDGLFGLSLLEELPVAAAVLPRVVASVEVLVARVVPVLVFVAVMVVIVIVVRVIIVTEVAVIVVVVAVLIGEVGGVIIVVLPIPLGGLLGRLRSLLGRL